MIELMDTLDELGEHTRILIYPCINLVLMREDILKLLQSFGDENIPDEEENLGVFREEEEAGDEFDTLEGEKTDGDTAVL